MKQLYCARTVLIVGAGLSGVRLCSQIVMLSKWRLAARYIEFGTELENEKPHLAL
jgi:NADH dehydrogenase FAD-containing subunit